MTTKPDALIQSDGKGLVGVVANEKARRLINKLIEGPGLHWRDIESSDDFLTSPEYLAFEIEEGPAVWAMACALHQDGLALLYWCEG
jgi:hypothetical protein